MNNDYRRKNIQDIFISGECVERFQTQLSFKIGQYTTCSVFLSFYTLLSFLPSFIISTLKYKLSFSSLNSTHVPVVQSLVYFSCSSLSFMFQRVAFVSSQVQTQPGPKYKQLTNSKKKEQTAKNQADPQQHKVCSSKVFGHLVLPEQLRCALALIPQVSGTSI